MKTNTLNTLNVHINPSQKKNLVRRNGSKKIAPSYNAIKKFIMDNKNLNDMNHLTQPYHTGSLEVFHSLINSYATKQQEFELNVMDACIKLAIIDHNFNVNRNQAIVRKEKQGSGKIGEKCFKYVSSKIAKDLVAKPVKEQKSYEFIKKLMKEVVERKLQGSSINVKACNLENNLKSLLNIAYTERPEKSNILENYNAMKRLKK